MSAPTLILLVFAAGGGVAVQALINARLGMVLGGPVLAAAVNFIVGALVIFAVLLVTRTPLPSLSVFGQASWWMFIGGFFGAFLVSIGALAAPKLGAGLLITLIVAGQLILAVIIDHFGWFGLKQQSIDLWRVLGVLMLLGGAALIQRGG